MGATQPSQPPLPPNSPPMAATPAVASSHLLSAVGALSIGPAAAPSAQPPVPSLRSAALLLTMPSAESGVSPEPSPRLSAVSAESSSDNVAPLASAQPRAPSDAPQIETLESWGAQLVCNALTGEVEVALPPGAGRQVSHNTASVRRQISMLFEDDAHASTPPPSSTEVWGPESAIIGAC